MILESRVIVRPAHLSLILQRLSEELLGGIPVFITRYSLVFSLVVFFFSIALRRSFRHGLMFYRTKWMDPLKGIAWFQRNRVA